MTEDEESLREELLDLLAFDDDFKDMSLRFLSSSSVLRRFSFLACSFTDLTLFDWSIFNVWSRYLSLPLLVLFLLLMLMLFSLMWLIWSHESSSFSLLLIVCSFKLLLDDDNLKTAVLSRSINELLRLDGVETDYVTITKKYHKAKLTNQFDTCLLFFLNIIQYKIYKF